jgi:hypothetical protein
MSAFSLLQPICRDVTGFTGGHGQSKIAGYQTLVSECFRGQVEMVSPAGMNCFVEATGRPVSAQPSPTDNFGGGLL